MPSSDDPTTHCPRCSSHDIERYAAPDAEPDVLSADAEPARAEPPNMRCNNCKHTWWLAPTVPGIDPQTPGVAP